MLLLWMLTVKPCMIYSQPASSLPVPDSTTALQIWVPSEQHSPACQDSHDSAATAAALRTLQLLQQLEQVTLLQCSLYIMADTVSIMDRAQLKHMRSSLNTTKASAFLQDGLQGIPVPQTVQWGTGPTVKTRQACNSSNESLYCASRRCCAVCSSCSSPRVSRAGSGA
jgi:hypothetical protein